MILNLPPSVRSGFFNIIPLFFWQGYLYENFNGIFENNLPELINILENHLEINISGNILKLKIFIHLLIGDSPGQKLYILSNLMENMAAFTVSKLEENMEDMLEFIHTAKGQNLERK